MTARLWPLGLLLVPTAAAANPHALPFSYPYATLPQDGLEIEQYVDLTPVPTIDTTGAKQTTPRAILTTEFEYGITSRLELGLYLQSSNDPGAGTGESPLRFDGLKQRLRLRLAEAGEWPVDVALYAETAELANEFEIEAKVILEKRIDRLQILVNLWAERELYYSGRREWVLNPTAGASYEINPTIHLGVEYWMHGEYGASVPTSSFNADTHHYLGPTVLFLWNRLWWATGIYARLDQTGRPAQFGDQFGPVWVRTIIGVGW